MWMDLEIKLIEIKSDEHRYPMIPVTCQNKQENRQDKIKPYILTRKGWLQRGKG